MTSVRLTEAHEVTMTFASCQQQALPRVSLTGTNASNLPQNAADVPEPYPGARGSTPCRV